MEYNPLDLLASAAELQQKHDDIPEKTVVTRRRYNSANSKLSQEEHQKENKETPNNNNNNNHSIKSKGPVVIRKIKVGVNPELEKMLNEHNYGNAKRSQRYEKGMDIVSDNNRRNRERTESVSDSSSQTTDTTKESQTVSTVERNGDTISVIDGSQVSDSECKCGKRLSEKGGNTDTCTDSCSCVCLTSGDKSKLNLNCSKCNHSDCNCPRPSWEHVNGEHSEVNSQPCDKNEGQPPDKLTEKHDSISVHVDKPCNQKEECSSSCLQVKKGENSSPSSDITLERLSDKSRLNLNSSPGISDKNRNNCELVTSREDKSVSVSIDLSNERKGNDMVTCSVSSNGTNKVDYSAASDIKKMPYVKVIPANVVTTETEKSKPETVVINICKRSQGTSGNLAITESSETRTRKIDHFDTKNSKIGIIRSLLTTDRINGKSGDCDKIIKPVISEKDSQKVKLNISRCDVTDLGEKLCSYDSLKTLELTNSLCSDSSSTSVHLLSPDRRNPDSMGIAESPVTNTPQDSLCSAEFDSEIDKSQDVLSNSTSRTFGEISDIFINGAAGNNVICRESFSQENGMDFTCERFSDEMENTTKPFAEPSSEAKELIGDSILLSVDSDKQVNSDNSANESVTGDNEGPIFRFESDHCYAGLPGKINDTRTSSEFEPSSSHSDAEEASTPLGSMGELSQDSGYEDVTQSPVNPEVAPPNVEKPSCETENVKNLVPVLISVDSNGCLTVHNNTNLTKGLGGQIFSVSDNMSGIDSGIKLISGTNLSTISPTPLILSPVGKATSPLLLDSASHLAKMNTENILGLLHATSPEGNGNLNLNLKLAPSLQQVSPPKFGKFRIGTFASFSNTGIGIEESLKLTSPAKNSAQVKSQCLPPVQRAVSNGVKSSPLVVDTLSTLVQKVKSSLSSSAPSPQIDNINMDHIQHDHDYCLKNLMPSFVNSVLETKFQSKETSKGKVLHSKVKKEADLQKAESKSGKRKRTSSNVGKEEEEIELDDESDINYDFTRPKTRAEKYIEQKSSEPKVKITGSSNFKDQFVYFMNTKKRNRRRESRDSPLPMSSDRVFIPPKPGDIVVPHLTDQDIENLKLRSKQGKHSIGLNTLRNEFMASKLSNLSFASQSQSDSTDDEKNIINTILSMENENLSSPGESEPGYNESMEMYGQGLGGDIMHLLPEQMNLTQEQMDILLSAVDEVQNSSPSLVGAEKLVSSDTGGSPLTQFPIPPPFENSPATPDETSGEATHKSAASIKQGNTTPATNDNLVESKDSVSESVEKLDTAASTADMVKSEKETDSSPAEPSLTVTVNPSIDASKPSTPDIIPGSCDSRKSSCSSESSLSLPTDVSLSAEPSVASSVSSKSSFTDLTENDSTGSAAKSITKNTSIASSTISNSLNTDMSLSSLDRSSLDLLGHEFRLQTDFFQEAVIPVPVAQGSLDYSAPWIVTVSMYWNDLPAIMMKNQPFIRLVDIHKQILPAKDTGILKKRCQLMGIEVENCSEMQRYFLVQYGRAFNSKSTLLISKDDAKELIGYYVDPQPKTLRFDDHKSIIDHRREQLRRIALARRAAMRARRANGKKDEEDPRAINDLGFPDQYMETNSPVDACSSADVARVLSGVRPHAPLVQTPGVTPQRSTRHKKINFLEMLRGDSTGNAPEDDNAGEDETHKKQNNKRLNSADSTNSAKRKNTSQDKKVKIVKYSVETDSSEETESNNSESDFSSSERSNTLSDTEIVVVKKQTKKPKVSVNSLRLKSKLKFKVVPKKSNVKIPPLKVKFSSNNRRNKKAATSTPVSVEVVNRSLGTLTAPVFRSKTSEQSSGERWSFPGTRSFSPPFNSTEEIVRKASAARRSSTPSVTSETCGSTHNGENNIFIDKTETNDECVSVHADLSVDDAHFKTCELIRDEEINKPELKIDESDLKITPTLPEEILEMPTSAKTKEMETNTEFNFSPDQLVIEQVNESTNTSDLNDDVIATLSDVQTENRSSSDIPLASNTENLNSVVAPPSRSDSRSQSPILSEIPHIGMKRKEIVQISSDEVPLRIIHRDSSPQSLARTRSQIGEIFVERYNNKKSLCIRCYTCRKMMSVDNFMRHLHDVANGGLISISDPRTIDTSESELNRSEGKLWETFQRKKELFDNNQLPSPEVENGIVYTIDSDSNQSLPENVSPIDIGVKSAGPRVITTPISPVKKQKSIKQTKPAVPKVRAAVRRPSLSQKTPSVFEQNEGVRSSGRKRKMKQLYPFEEYTYTKFPRLQNGTEETKETGAEQAN